MQNGRLYLVGTPIGNLGDMTPRAIETLKIADVIAAEDTRNTLKLLNHFDIKKPLVSYHEHNRRTRGEELVQLMEEGKICALVTDAGMPAISDPGEDLVSLCHERGVEVAVVPGPSAVVSAVAAAGLGGGRFTFEGFLSVSNRRRREHLLSLKRETRAMVFYEAPHKLPDTLRDLADTFGEERRVSLSRELTKKYEETVRMTLGEAVRKYEELKPLGEFVLVVEGLTEAESEDYKKEEEADAKERAKAIIFRLRAENATNRDILKAVMKETGLKRNEAYEMIIGDE
ncbi:MAG: 16S rRNA (cytidine(1402)-2'-O)-methyltransferase [Clostridia bacterium]|nr:16S rRNA (cytidine(1402)-2'-O)-methyltransferase [Clostridia bacterium]